MKILLGVVLYFVLHMALVVAFPSYSQDAKAYQQTMVEQQQDRAVMEAFQKAQG